MSDFSDSATPISELRQVVFDLVEKLDWRQIHSPKNVAMSLAVESVELMENFQWPTTVEPREITPENSSAVDSEMADAFCYLLAIDNELDIELSAAFENKMAKNWIKDFAVQYRG